MINKKIDIRVFQTEIKCSIRNGDSKSKGREGYQDNKILPDLDIGQSLFLGIPLKDRKRNSENLNPVN